MTPWSEFQAIVHAEMRRVSAGTAAVAIEPVRQEDAPFVFLRWRIDPADDLVAFARVDEQLLRQRYKEAVRVAWEGCSKAVHP